MSPASYQTAPPRPSILLTPVRVVNREAENAARKRERDLVGQDPDVAVAMDLAEFDHLFFDRRRIRLRIAEHVLLGRLGIDSVGLN